MMRSLTEEEMCTLTDNLMMVTAEGDKAYNAYCLCNVTLSS